MPGRVLAGRYEVRGRLGVGGMGAVYRVFDREVGEEVALKVVQAERVAEPGTLERFRREVRLARRIAHPHVCRVFDLGEAEGIRFLTMALVEGQTLRAVLVQGTPPPERACELLEQIALGLAAAHERGIVHRDLKPENVIVHVGGGAVVMDFGLASGAPPGEKVNTTVIAGTPGYMSPEQLRGEGLDVRSDVFSLGIVGYELLCGRSPFGEGSAAQVNSAILRDPPRPLDLTGVSTDHVIEIRAILERALQKRPEDRFTSAHDFAVAIASVRRSLATAPLGAPAVRESEGAPSTGQPARGARGVLRRRWIALLLAVLTAGGVAYSLASARPPVQPSSALPLASRLGLSRVEPRVTVLRFENHTGDPDMEGLARSAAEAVRAGLRTLPGLVVTEGPLQVQEQDDGPSWTVHGSVERPGTLLRLTTQFQAGSATGPIEIDGVLPGALLDTLRERAIDEARLLLREHDRRVRASRMTSSEAARSKLLTYYDTIGPAARPQHINIDIPLLDEAIAEDPRYVPALVERSYLLQLRAWADNRQEHLAASLADVNAALEVAPNDPEALLMKCRVMQFALRFDGTPKDPDIDNALRACTAARAKAPSSARVRITLARLYDQRCEDEKATRTLEEALELDRSLEGTIRAYLVELAMIHGQVDAADEHSERLVEFREEEIRLGEKALSRRAGVRETRGAYLRRAAVLLRLERWEQARRAIEKELKSAATADDLTEAAAIRGLLRIPTSDGIASSSEQRRRLDQIEAKYKAMLVREPATASNVAGFYVLTDPKAAVAWIERMKRPESCDEAILRAVIYRAAGDDRAARAALDSCTPEWEWERACISKLSH